MTKADPMARGQDTGAEPPVRRMLLAEVGLVKGLLILTVLLGLVVTATVIAQAGLLAHVLATAAASGSAALTGSLVALLAVVLVRGAAAYGGEVTALRAAAAVKERLRSKVIGHALMLGPAWLGGQRAGEVTTLAAGGLDALDPYFGRYLPQVLLAGLVPVAVVATVTASDPLSGLIIALTLPLIPVLAALIGLHTKARTRRSWQMLALLSGHFLDVVQGLTTLKIFGRARDQEHIIARITDQYRTSVMANLKVAFLSALVLELSAAVATALIAVEVGLRLLFGHIGYSTALLVLLLTPEAYLPLRNAAAQFHASADGTAVARRAFEILGTRRPSPAEPGPLPVRRAQGSGRPVDLRSDTIRFNAVAVAYPDGPGTVIDRADLVIEPGDLIVLTGRNGAGKTSLLHVLLKLVRPVGGSVDVGDAGLATVPDEAWRAQIGWLPQRPVLFGWSVADNIALGRAAADRSAIRRAAEAAGADQFIAALPDGYDTVLDERASRLSAGQRQKLALARVLLRDAPLMLLDEPTAHLDPASAAAIAAAIATAPTGRTVVMVTHRQPAILAAHRTIVVADGCLTELTGALTP